MVFPNCTLLEFYNGNLQWLLSILWTDKIHFSLHGKVNTLNYRILEKKNRLLYTEKSLHALHITAWCSFTSDIFEGPFFFKEVCTRIDWKTCSVNRKRYLEMLRQKMTRWLLEHNVHDKVIFMQDGDTLHIATEVKQYLKKTFIDER